MSSEFQTTSLHVLLDRIHAGDGQAQNELIRRIGGRMELLCRKMLNQFTRLRTFEETGDVMTNASWRLLRSLEAVRPGNTREFFALAAEHVRRELLDLAKHYDARRRAGAARAIPLQGDADASDPPLQIADSSDPPDELARWSAFHDVIPRLPDEEREVFVLIFYHGCKQPEIAKLLECSEKTVHRRWLRACIQLKELLGDEIPTL